MLKEQNTKSVILLHCNPTVLKSNYSKVSQLYEKVMKAYDTVAKFD